MYYLYILFSENLNKFYIGVSSNPEERLKRHLSNHNGFTAKTKDWKMIYTETFENKIDALKREKQIKNWKNRKLIESLIHKA